MINIECVIGADGVINASISKDLVINVDVISSGPQGKTGPKGDRGITGLTGPLGPQGIQGNQGSQGEQGIQGIQGETGIQGIQGIQGLKGDKGDRGTDGVITEISGQYAFQIIDGDLYVLYPDDATAPDYSINEDGYLVLAL
jgi:hypothetical protein